VSPLRYERNSYIPEDGNLRSHRHEDLKSYMDLLLFSYEMRETPIVLGPLERGISSQCASVASYS
jgi:hypothetical protein